MSTALPGSSMFQSTLPVGGATIDFPMTENITRRFNPRSPWGERRLNMSGQGCRKFVSIHAPRGGSDDTFTYSQCISQVSIHAPRGGSDDPSNFQI